MKQSELEALPIANKSMFGAEMVWDKNGDKWWIGVIDGKPHRRPFGPQFFTATFEVTRGDEVVRVRVPFTGDYSARVLDAARKWGAGHFNCAADDLDCVKLASS